MNTNIINDEKYSNKCEFIRKCKKKYASLCGEMRKKHENGFWAAPALVSLTWRGELEISMLPKHQFLQ